MSARNSHVMRGSKMSGTLASRISSPSPARLRIQVKHKKWVRPSELKSGRVSVGRGESFFSVHLHYRNDLCCQTKKTVTNLSTPLVTFPPQLLFFRSLCHLLGLILDNYTPLPPQLMRWPHLLLIWRGGSHLLTNGGGRTLALCARVCTCVGEGRW